MTKFFSSKYLTTKYLLAYIVVLAFVLRLLGLINIHFEGDFALFWHSGEDIAVRHQLLLLGPHASIQESFHLGPFYYYFLAVIYLLSGGNFQVGIIWQCLINSLTILLLYKACKYWLTTNESLLVCLLYATSFYMITTGNFPWNPYTLTPFLFGNIILYKKISAGQYKLLPLMFLLLSLASHLHGSILFLTIVTVGMLIPRKIPLSYWLIGVVVAVLPYLPWFYAEKSCSFCQLQAMTQTLSAAPAEKCVFVEWLHTHGNGERCFGYIRNSLFVLKLFSQSLLGSASLLLLPLMAIFIAAWVYFVRVKDKLFLSMLFFGQWFLFLFYKGNIYQHYFLILLPLPFMFFVMLLSEAKRRFPKQQLFINTIPAILCVSNIVLFLLSLSVARG